MSFWWKKERKCPRCKWKYPEEVFPKNARECSFCKRYLNDIESVPEQPNGRQIMFSNLAHDDEMRREYYAITQRFGLGIAVAVGVTGLVLIVTGLAGASDHVTAKDLNFTWEDFIMIGGGIAVLVGLKTYWRIVKTELVQNWLGKDAK